MKKHKKIIILIILIITLTLSLSACFAFDVLQRLERPPETTTEPIPEATPQTTPEVTPEPTPQPDPVEDPPETPDISSENPDKVFPFAFSTTDIYGNPVTEASLGDKEIYYVHFWGTWCPPCIAEMPDIGQLILEYQDRVGFLMLLDDFENTEGVLNIYESSGITESMQVITVCYADTFPRNHEIIRMVSSGYVPTTALIDSDGNLLEQLIGAHFSQYAELLDHYLSIVS